MKLLPILLAALVGGVAGGLGATALSDREERRPAPREVARVEIPAELSDAIAQLRVEVAGLRSRLERGDRATTGEAGGAGGGVEVPGAGRPEPAAGGGPPGAGAAADESAAAVVRGILGKPFRSAESTALWSYMVLHKERIGEVISLLEAEVGKDPQNAELRVALATAYVGRLTNDTAPGPQQGLVWAQAERSYDAAIKLVPDHWQARFGKAFGTSMIPAFLGRRPDAIRQFEELMEIQERQPPTEDQAQTYFRLGDLYKEAGNMEKAKSIWERGRKLHPENKELREAIETLEQR